MQGNACGLRKETGVSFPPPPVDGQRCCASSAVGRAEGARREVAYAAAKGGGPGTFPGPQACIGVEDSTSEARRSRRTGVRESLPAMGSKSNCGLGKAGACSRMHGIAQGSKGECTGALKLQNASLCECMRWFEMAVVDGFCSNGWPLVQERRCSERCESRFCTGKASEVSDKVDGK